MMMFSETKMGVVTTTQGRDNFHTEGEAKFTPMLMLTNDKWSLEDYPADRFDEDSLRINPLHEKKKKTLFTQWITILIGILEVLRSFYQTVST